MVSLAGVSSGCKREFGKRGAVRIGVSSSVGCVNISSGAVSLFRDRCLIPGKVSCGSCLVISRGITVVSAISGEGASR